MADHTIGQILQAFNSIESKLQEQNGVLRELTAKVNSLEGQNRQLTVLVQKLQCAPPASGELIDQQNHEFQDVVTERLRSIEDQSKKALELIKASGSGAKKRAWP